MSNIKISISIPYKQRLDNLAIVFEALANQTMDRSLFEVVVGAMEYSEEYVALCKKFTDSINIVSVLSAKDFSIPRARNLAMRQATGEIVVQMDADTLLPKHALQNLYYKHFAFGQNICVVGQVVGYGNNNDGDLESVVAEPYNKYQKALEELEKSKGNPRDPRFQADHVLPWAFGWTGLITLPLSIVRKHNLYFDETFHGWGVDDLEWSYRICKSGTPIVLREDVYAIHLPHSRNQTANRKTEQQNYRRFLHKWPSPDVELAHAFGDVKANDLFLDFMQELRKVTDKNAWNLGTARGIIAGNDVLIIGVLMNKDHRILDKNILNLFDNRSQIEVLPLIGMALPFLDKEISESRILPSISKFPKLYLEAVRREVERVSKTVAPIA